MALDIKKECQREQHDLEGASKCEHIPNPNNEKARPPEDMLLEDLAVDWQLNMAMSS
jgi:hypothetical protein